MLSSTVIERAASPAYLRVLRREAYQLLRRREEAEKAGDWERAERIHNQWIGKMRAVCIVRVKVGYIRPYALKKTLNRWDHGGYNELYTRGIRRVRYEGKQGKRCKGPRRRKVNAAFPQYLFDSGEIQPYPGYYEVWVRKLPKWLAKRWETKERNVSGGYIYIEK